MKFRLPVAVVTGLIFALSAGIFLKNLKKNGTSHLLILDLQDPYSADPYLYDLQIHHIIFGGVYSKLFSVYANSKISNSAVGAWRSSESYTNWEFDIREDIHFSNGDKVTAEDFAQSLKRFLLLSRKSKSNLAMARDLIGTEKLDSMKTEISGIQVKGNTVLLKLKRSNPDLKENLSSGNFSIVHRNDYDPVDGSWKSFIPVSSGPYKLVEFNLKEKFAVLTLRDDFPSDLRHENAFTKITVSWNPERRKDADILDAYEGEVAPSRNHVFMRNNGTDLVYLHIFSWQDSSNLFSNPKIRKLFRERFYETAERLGLKVVRSFFPLILTGVSEVEKNHVLEERNFLDGNAVRVKPPRNLQVPNLKKLKEALIATVADSGGNIELKESIKSEQSVRMSNASKDEKVELDFSVRSTSMGVEDPILTVKQMFSKEGINIPDPTGRARKIIDGDFSLTKLNEVIFDDAIVIPVYHYSNGFWANDRIDFSRYNTMLAVSELQWLGEK